MRIIELNKYENPIFKTHDLPVKDATGCFQFVPLNTQQNRIYIIKNG